MNLLGIQNLATRWVAIRGKFSDAWEELDVLLRKEPAVAFRVIEEIHNVLVSSEPRDMQAWALLAAGPLEDLLAENGEAVIATAEALSKTDPEFRKLLSGVWQNSMSDELYARVQKASDPTYRFTPQETPPSS